MRQHGDRHLSESQPSTPIEPIDTSKLTPEQRKEHIRSLIRSGLSQSEIASQVKKPDGTPITESYVYKIKREMIASGALAKGERILAPEKPELVVEEEEKKIIIAPPTIEREKPPTLPPGAGISLEPEVFELWTKETVAVMIANPLNFIFKRAHEPELDQDEIEALGTTGKAFFDKITPRLAQYQEVVAFGWTLFSVVSVRIGGLYRLIRPEKRATTEEIPKTKVEVPVEGKKTTVEHEGKASTELPAWYKPPSESESTKTA